MDKCVRQPASQQSNSNVSSLLTGCWLAGWSFLTREQLHSVRWWLSTEKQVLLGDLFCASGAIAGHSVWEECINKSENCHRRAKSVNFVIEGRRRSSPQRWKTKHAMMVIFQEMQDMQEMVTNWISIVIGQRSGAWGGMNLWGCN